MSAARAGAELAELFGPEPRGVTYRPTMHVLSVIGYTRDEDALNARVQRAMMKAH